MRLTRTTLALNNITAGVREREAANRTREAGHLDEIQDVGGPCAETFGRITADPKEEAKLGTDLRKMFGCRVCTRLTRTS